MTVLNEGVGANLPASVVRDSSAAAGSPISPAAGSRTKQSLRDLPSPFDWGAVGDGATDDTTALQNFLNFLQANPSTMGMLPGKAFAISAALSITSPLSLLAAGAVPLFGSRTSAAGFETLAQPSLTPYVQGAVLLQTAAATNILNVTGSGIAVNIHGGLGLRFADSIAFSNTGHGIFAVPSQVYAQVALNGLLSTGAPITALPVAAIATAIASGTVVTVTSGANTQTWTLTGTAAQGATSLAVSSQTPNFAYPSGSTVVAASGVSTLDNGMMGSMWGKVIVAGHDGNHYAVYQTNGELNTFESIFSFGGGVFHFDTNSSAGGANYGNTTVGHLYGSVCAGGSAHGIEIRCPSAGSTNGSAQIFTFNRPQIWLRSTGITAFGSAPTNAQKLFAKDSGAKMITMHQADFESNIAGSLFDSDSHVWWTGGHYFTPTNVAPTGGTFFQGRSMGDSDTFSDYLIFTSSTFQTFRNNAAGSTGDITLPLSATPGTSMYLCGFLGAGGGGPTTTLAAGANAGTSPPAPVVATGTTLKNLRGAVTFGTGTTPAAGAMVVVTHGQAEPFNSPVPMVTPLNAATAALGLYVSAFSKTAFTVSCTSAPAASQANTIYSFGYHCLG